MPLFYSAIISDSRRKQMIRYCYIKILSIIQTVPTERPAGRSELKSVRLYWTKAEMPTSLIKNGKHCHQDNQEKHHHAAADAHVVARFIASGLHDQSIDLMCWQNKGVD